MKKILFIVTILFTLSLVNAADIDLDKDYYATLGITKTATSAEIKKAYRQMALKHHPDRNPGDPTATAKFQEIGEAYGVLSNPELKTDYDDARMAPPDSPEHTQQFIDNIISKMQTIVASTNASEAKIISRSLQGEVILLLIYSKSDSSLRSIHQQLNKITILFLDIKDLIYDDTMSIQDLEAGLNALPSKIIIDHDSYNIQKPLNDALEKGKERIQARIIAKKQEALRAQEALHTLLKNLAVSLQTLQATIH